MGCGARISTAPVVLFPFASPTAPPPIQHGAVLQKMEMLAVSVAGQMVARKGRHRFPTYPDKFPGVVSLYLKWP